MNKYTQVAISYSAYFVVDALMLMSFYEEKWKGL